MDFDPRDYDDARQDDRHADIGERGNSDDRDWDDSRQPEFGSRDRDDDARDLGRGPGDSRGSTGNEADRDPRDDARWPERERDTRDRTVDQREPFTRGLNLPRGRDRELVQDRDRQYTLRGSETRTLATVGAFRVVSSRDLRDHHDRSLDPRSGDLRHLREQRLVETQKRNPGRERPVYDPETRFRSTTCSI